MSVSYTHLSVAGDVASLKSSQTVERFADFFSAEGYILPVPLLVDSKIVANLIRIDSHVQNVMTVSYTHLDVYKRQDMCIPMLNVKTREYDDRLFELFGIMRYKDRMPKMRTVRENKAMISPEAAKTLGFSEKTLITGGPMDIGACMLSCGVTEDCLLYTSYVYKIQSELFIKSRI